MWPRASSSIGVEGAGWRLVGFRGLFARLLEFLLQDLVTVPRLLHRPCELLLRFLALRLDLAHGIVERLVLAPLATLFEENRPGRRIDGQERVTAGTDDFHAIRHGRGRTRILACIIT